MTDDRELGIKSWLSGPKRSQAKVESVDENHVILDSHRVAVLPFASMSPNPDDEYFADGMTEEVISTLSRVPDIEVISRTSVMHYKKNPKPIKEVAKELYVGTVLEGSVRKAGNRLRITFQVIDASRDRHLWAESYDRGLEDIFGIQSDISQKVVDVLRVQLLAHERKGLESIPTQSVDAYTEFLKGRQQLNDRTEKGFYDAIDHFENAVRIDPKFARAYSGLADAYLLLENWAIRSPEEVFPKAMRYVMMALELDDSLADAHTSLAYHRAHVTHDWAGGEREFQYAIRLNPSYATAHLWYGFGVLQMSGRWDEAIREIEEATKLDSFSVIIMINKARILLWSGRREEALDQFRHASRLFTDHWNTHSELGAALVSMSKVDEGMLEIEKARKLGPEGYLARVRLAYAFVAAGKRRDAERILGELREGSTQRYVPATSFAMIYAVLGEKEQAFEWLNRAVQDGSSSIVLLNDIMFDPIRTDARFHKLLENLGLSPRQREPE